MTTDVLSLYHAVILDHSRHPRNLRALEHGRRADGSNPLCGDRITVYVRLDDDGRIREAAFEGVGCAIFMASSSLMTGSVTGRTVAEADALGRQVRDLVAASPADPVGDLGPLSALAGVRQFPVRARCALLPWEALHAALHAHDTSRPPAD